MTRKLIKKKLKYISILVYILGLISPDTIMDNISGIEKQKLSSNGFKWYPELNLSVRGKNANSTLLNIIKLVELENINFYIEIQLKNGENIYYKNP